MIFAVGWCVLRTSRDAREKATVEEVHAVDATILAADQLLWSSFRTWMDANASPWLLWTLCEQHNNHKGVLQVFLSRNHRASPFWPMLKWIAENGPGSYGLFYVHDDEDVIDHSRYGRGITADFDNVFRVHRIANGRVEELEDPFFGPIVPNLEPRHPYDRGSDEDEMP